MTFVRHDNHLLQRGHRLEYATLGWNVLGILVLAFAALRAPLAVQYHPAHSPRRRIRNGRVGAEGLEPPTSGL